MITTENYIDNSSSDSENIIKETEKFNISYILIKIDDNLCKRKYLKIVKEIMKIEKENTQILSQKNNIKYFVYLFEIKILCLCRVIEGKFSELCIYRKNSLIFNYKSDNMKSLEKLFDKLKKILEEDIVKLKEYISDKSILTDNMKEHIILSYARGIYLQGKFCKLKKQISDAASFFNIGINLLKANINKCIESETFCLYGKLLISLSCILIEDKSYLIASEKIIYAINFFIKSLFLTSDNPNGINIEEVKHKIKNNSFIFSIKGLIISLFLLGICLEKINLLDNAVVLYNQSFWIFKKFFRKIDPIFYSIIEDIKEKINQFKEDLIKEIKNKYVQEKKLEKIRLIQEKNQIKAMKLTNISNRGSFNAERYLKIEKRLKNILVNVEKKYGNKDDEGKIFLPIIKYLNQEKNKFDFTFNYLVKEKEKQMEKRIMLKKDKNMKIMKTENNLIKNESKIKLFKSFNINLSNNHLLRNKKKAKQKLNLTSFDNNNITTLKRKATFSYKEKFKKKLLPQKNNKFLNEELKSEEYGYIDTKPDSNIAKSKSNSINMNFQTLNSFQSSEYFKTNKLSREEKNYHSIENQMNKNKIKQYIIKNKIENKKQKDFLTKNSFVFCKSFKKGIKYLEKMDKREMIFQKQLIHLKNLEAGFDHESENNQNKDGEFNNDKIRDEAENAYMKIKDKIDDKYKNENTIEFIGSNEKQKEIEKIMLQKVKLENSLIMGLNDSKIDKIKKLEENLEEIKQKQFIKMLNKDINKYSKKTLIYDEEKLINEIEHANKRNNQMMDTLDNEIIKCEEKNMVFKKRKKGFNLPINLRKFKIKLK